jgi:hypothetical protein
MVAVRPKNAAYNAVNSNSEALNPEISNYFLEFGFWNLFVQKIRIQDLKFKI